MEEELNVPEGEALEDNDDLMQDMADEDEAVNEEASEYDVANEELDEDDPDSIPPDEGDDEQGDWPANKMAGEVGDQAGRRQQRHDKNLNAKERTRARRIAVRAALLGLRHASVIHYTQGGSRWQGIADTRFSERGQYPNYADCSAFATWCLWNGLYVPFREHDVVNGADWKAGYTGTMLSHGVPIRSIKNVRWGDCVLYGSPGSTGRHTAIVVRVGKPRGSKVMVVSHGSEGGPYFLPYNYRRDVQSIRRYTHYKVV